MKRNYLYRILFIGFIVLSVAGIYLYNYSTTAAKKEKESKEFAIEQEKALMEHLLRRAISEKQKAINAIALAIEFDSNISKRIESGIIPKNYASTLTTSLRKYTNYKNIWLEIFDANASSLYKSWYTESEHLQSDTKEITDLLGKKKVVNFIDVDSFDLCINSFLNLWCEDGKNIGALEVKAHFNSIAKKLSEYKINSVVLVDKAFKNRLHHPFTSLFVQDYYVANKNVSAEILDLLQKEGVERFLRKSVQLVNGMMAVSYPLRNSSGMIIAHYIMFKNLQNVTYMFEKETMSSFMKVSFITFVIALFAIFLYDSHVSKSLQKFYKSVIDNSKNIIIITDGNQMIDVNKAFLEYFGVNSIEEFTKGNEHCLHDYFQEGEEYLNQIEGGMIWFLYVLKYPQKKHKLKLKIGEKIYYFLASASKLDTKEELYSIVLADITQEENYRLELERTAVTDALTGIRNRRFFEEKLQEEIRYVIRYSRRFSLIVLDIDHFKRINDHNGHDVGDEALVDFVKTVKSCIRETDIFCRVGGEEFAIILPETPLNNAVEVARKINKTVKENRHAGLNITVSIGVVEYRKGESDAEIYKRADNALYDAKHTGRDKVVIG